ncbi:hypothetical protein EW146_g2547 [Bondarzewia mesenterica]|uniref:Uncharacterized protein n=1 Tax=Bondarzewia mesenterica TaxID=1095465 RepID=A0A4S4M264_9AGAM|nr:hypothetical protein EW146_g2547 [Bondarzewia mesenterica]
MCDEARAASKFEFGGPRSKHEPHTFPIGVRSENAAKLSAELPPPLTAQQRSNDEHLFPRTPSIAIYSAPSKATVPGSSLALSQPTGSPRPLGLLAQKVDARQSNERSI